MVNVLEPSPASLPISDIEALRVIADSQRHRMLTVPIERQTILERTYLATARHVRVDDAWLDAGASQREIGDARAVILEQAAEDLRSRSGTDDASHDNDVLVARGFMHLNDARRRALRPRLIALFEEFERTPISTARKPNSYDCSHEDADEVS